MFKWIKKGLIYNPTAEENRPLWKWNFAQGQNALVFDDFVRVYFCTREKPNEKNQTVSRISFVDFDKYDLHRIVNVSDKPIFELGEIGEFDEFGTYPFCPIRIGNKIYGYYGGVTRCESVPFNVAIGCVVSSDGGNSFERIGHGPVLSYSVDEPFVICSPKVRFFNNCYYMFYSAGREWVETNNRPEIYYKLRMAVSNDGLRWEKLHKDIIPDKLGEQEAQACADVIFKNGKYHMFFCYRKNLDFRINKQNSYRIGYASSTDLVNWHREDEKSGIDVSENVLDFDNQMVAYPNIFEVDGDMFMLYLGNEVGKYGFGLAKMEGDLI